MTLQDGYVMASKNSVSVCAQVYPVVLDSGSEGFQALGETKIKEIKIKLDNLDYKTICRK